jgi:dipeptidyl aminopeptidase/acylaminoacyl peptidase
MSRNIRIIAGEGKGERVRRGSATSSKEDCGMNETWIAPYGSWQSPITPDLIASGTITLGQIALEGDDVYWVETRPSEGGRNVIIRWQPGSGARDLTPMPFNARTRVHEYGGGSFLVSQGAVYFVNFADQRIYRGQGEEAPQAVTTGESRRYADAIHDVRRNRLLCVREDHAAGGHEPANSLVAIQLDGKGAEEVVLSGNDFYSSPRLSPDGSRLAWLAWNHPNMPWDGTELWIGEVQPDGSLGRTEKVAGGLEESVIQPEWSPDGVLHFISDRSGWWNLYRWRRGRTESLCAMAAEFGRPPWVFAMSTYGFVAPDRIVCTFVEGGRWRLGLLDRRTARIEEIETPYTDVREVRVAAGHAVLCAGSPTTPSSIARLDLKERGLEVLRRSSDIPIDLAFFSVPEPIEFPTEGGKTAHAFFYAPRNPEYDGPAGELPPLLVKSHGGPTSATSTTLLWDIQYWTSRGFAVLDVNYGGSSDYGREYRQRLNGNWGIVDVDDCANGARYLVEKGRVDGTRLAIRGGSAGGYTTLCALTFRRVFRAGASYYGIGDLEALVRDTHKFEARYLDRLVGPYPERQDLYRERSPIHFPERLSCPVIFFQGLDDPVVPPNQAEMMVAALRAKGLPVAYFAFAGEQHGFRRAETIRRCLEAELYFYCRVFGFELADPVEPVAIENL